MGCGDPLAGVQRTRPVLTARLNAETEPLARCVKTQLFLGHVASTLEADGAGGFDVVAYLGPPVLDKVTWQMNFSAAGGGVTLFTWRYPLIPGGEARDKPWFKVVKICAARAGVATP